MKNFTKFLLISALLFVGVGGVKVYAGKVYGHLTTEGGYEATWNATSETMGWNSVGNYYPNFRILLTGLPSGNITGYTKFHATLSDFSDNATYVRLRIKSNDGSSDHYADVNLVDGENNVDLKALAEANPEVDFTNVTDITIWSPGSAESGKTVDADHPASVKIQNVYLQTVKNLTEGVLNTEITDLEYLTAGNRFVIANTDGTQIQSYPSNGPAATSTSLNSVTSELYYYFTIEALPALDIDNDGTDDDATYYRIAIQNADGTAKPTDYWHGNYVDRIGWGELWSTSCQADGATAFGEGQNESAYGRDGDYNAVWTITYESGNGFVIYNPKNAKYMTLSNTSDSKTYLKLYQSLDLTINSEFDKEDNAANEAIFALSNASGYDAETGVTTNATWTFTTPVDISNWDYLMITTINNPSDASHEITITDDNGVSVHGENYVGSEAGTGGKMWLDRWNNQNAIRISIDYLRINKSLDITKIKTLKINGTTKIANVYLTDYNNTKISGGYKDGDVKREYSATGKYGTICLPYVASYSGCEVYSIASGSASGISLTKVTGLLEAGKPYFYVSADENGKDNEGTVRNVNFFRADLAKYDAAVAGTNNGLVGTFSEITLAPNDNYYVLSSNTLYMVDEGATDDKAVTIGANKAYVDLSQISGIGGASRAFLPFNETTGIGDVKGKEDNARTLELFDLSGRRVTTPTKGLYIVNGKKVVIK